MHSLADKSRFAGTELINSIRQRKKWGGGTQIFKYPFDVLAPARWLR